MSLRYKTPKGFGYWRSLGVKLQGVRCQRDAKGKQIPITSPRGEYRRERARFLADNGLRPSHRQTVKAGKQLRRAYNIQQAAIARANG